MSTGIGLLQAGYIESGYASVSVAGTGAFNPTAAQYQNTFLDLTGVLTGNRTFVVPLGGPPPLLSGQWWFVNNQTTGAFTLTFIGPSGTGVVIPPGCIMGIRWDGTNMVAFTPAMFYVAAAAAPDMGVALVAVAGATTLTPAQYSCPAIDLSGAPGAGFNLVFPNPAQGQSWLVNNRTGQTATCNCGGGTTVAIATATKASVYSDGAGNMR